MDLGTLAEGLSVNADRQWSSIGIVQADTPGARSVAFNDADGKPLAQGYLVQVKLMPSGIVVSCRVSSHVAGNGEADFYPFAANDEVQVLVNEGNERSNCVIVGRLNQSFDAHPRSVAGQDTTTNTFGFRRMIAPYILECGNAYLIRNALTGSFFSMDAIGAITLTNSDKHYMALGHDLVGFVLGDNSALMQILPTDKQVLLQADGTQFLLDNDASVFLTPGTLAIGTAGLGATGHAVTLEQVINIIANVICGLASSAAFDSLGPWGAPVWSSGATALLTTLFALVLPGAATPNPIGVSGAPGGNLTALAIQPLIATALAAQLPDPQALAPVPIFQPGIGRAGFML